MELLKCPICDRNGLKPTPSVNRKRSDSVLCANEDFTHLVRRGGEHFLSRTRKNVLDEAFDTRYPEPVMVMN